MRRRHRHPDEDFDGAPIPGPPPSNLNAGSWAVAPARGPAKGGPGGTGDRTVGEQLVIVYGRGRATTVYAAAYTAHQAETALRRCVAHHGGWVSARVVPARSSLPGAL